MATSEPVKHWQTIRMRLDELKPADYNPRTIKQKSLKGLGESIDRFGLVQPIVYNRKSGNIIGGHQRYRILQERGEKEVDVVVVDIDEQEEVALNISLNNPAIEGEWTEAVEGILSDLRANSEELFDALRMNDLADSLAMDGHRKRQKEGKKDPDDIPPEQSKSVSKPGIIYCLGEHRLYCGDSTSVMGMGCLAYAGKARLVMTSPPYWVGKSYEYQESIEEIKKFIHDSVVIMSKFASKDGGRIIINTSTALARKINPDFYPETILTLAWWQDAFREHGWYMRNCRIWAKKGTMATRSPAPVRDLCDQHWETISTFYNPDGMDDQWDALATFYSPDGEWKGQNRTRESWAVQGVWDDIQPRNKESYHGHPAVFPVEIPKRFIQLYTREGDIIFDPFCGSGTTLIAAEQMNRKCLAVEIEPKYCDTIRRRWAEFVHGEDCDWQKLTPEET